MRILDVIQCGLGIETTAIDRHVAAIMTLLRLES